MTEEEAKTKVCHRVLVETTPWGENATGPGWRCIASDCMAWRTRHQWLDNAQQEPDWVNYAPYAFESGPGQERDDGYCGLAGAPS